MWQGCLFGLICVALTITATHAQDAKPFAKLEVKGKHRWITYLAFSPDGKTLAASHCAKFGPTFVTLWDAANGKRLREVDGPVGVLNYNPLVFSPNGKWLAIGGYDEVLLLDTDGKRADQVKLHETVVVHFAFSPDSQILASGSWFLSQEDQPAGYKNVILWNVTTKTNKTELKAKAGVRLDRQGVVGIAFSADGKTMTAVGHDVDVKTGWMVQVWNVSTLKTIRTFSGNKNDRFSSVELSTDGRILAVTKEEVLELWNTDDGKLIRTIKSRGEDWAVHLTKDGAAVAMVNLQRNKNAVVAAQLSLTDVQSGKLLATRKITSRQNEKFFGPVLLATPTGDIAAFQVDESEIALWDAHALLGVPLAKKHKD
jgi:WD40 repeat protein